VGLLGGVGQKGGAVPRALVDAAAQAGVTRALTEFNAENVKWLKSLRAYERVVAGDACQAAAWRTEALIIAGALPAVCS
jgi:hypothetical protein